MTNHETLLTVLAACVVAGIVGVGTGIIPRGKSTSEPKDPPTPTQTVTATNGGTAINNAGAVAGCDNITNVTEAAKPDLVPPLLEIVDITWTNDAELDLKVRNKDEIDLIVHSITLELLEDLKNGAAPMLLPTAKYSFDLDEFKVGESKTLKTSLVVPAQ